MRSLAPIALLLAGACCSTLPHLAPKRVAFPDLRPPYREVVETKGKFRDALRQRDIPIHTYTPVGAKPPFPIVVFSPAIGKDRDSYPSLGRAIARAGFYTVVLTHDGDRAANRALDASFVLDRLAEDNLLDMNRVAIVGDAAGAATALESQRDKRVKAIVAMEGGRIGLLGPIGRIGRTVWLEDGNERVMAVITAAFLRQELFDDRTAREWFDDAGCGDVMGTRVCVEHK